MLTIFLSMCSHIRDVFAQSLWQHTSMWFQVVREEKTRDGGELRKLTLAHLNPRISAAEVNGGHDNCLHYLSPVGDVWTLPLLSRQSVSPLPWPRSTFDLVRNATARLLHPTERREKRKRKEKKRKEEKGDSGFLNRNWGGKQHHETTWSSKWTQ